MLKPISTDDLPVPEPFLLYLFFYCIHDTTCTTEKLFKKFVICYDTFLVNVGGYLITNKMFLYLYLESFRKRSTREHDTHYYTRYM